MYAKSVLILLGVALAVIAVEWRARYRAEVIQSPSKVQPPDTAGLDRTIVDLDLQNVPRDAVFRILAAQTHTNIAWRSDDSNFLRDLPVSIHLQHVSLAVALRVIGDLGIGDVDGGGTLTYRIAPGGVIVVCQPPPEYYKEWLAPTMEQIDVGDLLSVEIPVNRLDEPPRRPMTWLYGGGERYPFFQFVCSNNPGLGAIVFGNKLVMNDTPERAQSVRELIEAVRHPIDPMQPFPALESRPVRRIAHFQLDNVPVDEAFERWRSAVAVNAAVMIPRRRGDAGERFPYNLSERVTVDLRDVSVEDAVAPIIRACLSLPGFGSISVYHDEGIVYVRPPGSSPPGVLRVFDVSQLIVHPERWYRDAYNPGTNPHTVTEEDLFKALSLALDDYQERNTYWHGRLAIFATPEELEKKARRLRAMLLQKSPDDYKPDLELPGNP